MNKEMESVFYDVLLNKARTPWLKSCLAPDTYIVRDTVLGAENTIVNRKNLAYPHIA